MLSRARPGWRIWLSAARPRTLPAAVAPVLVGTAIAWHRGGFAPLPALECLAFALLVQIGTNFANDYYDHKKGADTPERVGPVRAVAAGLVAPGRMRAAMMATFAAAFLAGMGLVARGGPWLVVIGVACIACGIAYTAGPFPLGYNGLGDLFVFLFFGLVAVTTTTYVQTGRWEGDAFLAAIPIGLLAVNILVANNYRDAETDAAAGKATLVVRLGKPFARRQFSGSLLVAMLAPVANWRAGGAAWTLLPLLLAPLAWSLSRRLARAGSPAELIGLLGDSGRFLALYAVLFSVGEVL